MWSPFICKTSPLICYTTLLDKCWLLEATYVWGQQTCSSLSLHKWKQRTCFQDIAVRSCGNVSVWFDYVGPKEVFTPQEPKSGMALETTLLDVLDKCSALWQKQHWCHGHWEDPAVSKAEASQCLVCLTMMMHRALLELRKSTKTSIV